MSLYSGLGLIYESVSMSRINVYDYVSRSRINV